jgi:alpha-1,3-rhamnosyltransferase
MNEIKPNVTALVLFYNHENFVNACLDSVFGQSYENMDVWIFDDASNDKTVSKVKHYLNKNTQNIKHKYLYEFNDKNIGVVAQVNKLYERSAKLGDFVVFFAGDDISLPHRVKHSVSLFQSNNSVFGLSLGVFKTMDLIQKYNCKNSTNKVFTLKNLLFNPLLQCPAPSRALRSAVFTDTPKLTKNMETEDTPLFWRTLTIGGYLYCDCPSVYYRVHNGNISSGKKRRFNRQLIFNDRCVLIRKSKHNSIMKVVLMFVAKKEMKIRIEKETKFAELKN